MWISDEYRNSERHAELAYRLGRAEQGGDRSRIRVIKDVIERITREEWGALLKENIRGNWHGEHWASAAIAADTKDTANRKEWLINRPMQLVGLRVDGITAGAGAATVVDFTSMTTGVTVSVDIFATAANRPTLAAASSGDFTIGAPDQAAGVNSDGQGHIFFRAGDRLGYYCVSVGANPHTRVAAHVIGRHT